MTWIYLSPHLDDVALSVGGLLWEQSQGGEHVAVWTICGGDPPPGGFSPFAESLHSRWETGIEAMQTRRTEDIEACRTLGAKPIHFDISDCIYRRSPKTEKHLYDSEDSLWIPVHPDEEELIVQLTKSFKELLPPDANVVCPLALGGHVDHRLTRSASERLGIPLWFYADYPYVLNSEYQKIIKHFNQRQHPSHQMDYMPGKKRSQLINPRSALFGGILMKCEKLSRSILNK